VRRRNSLAEIAEAAEKSQIQRPKLFQEWSKESLPSASLAISARVIAESG
jgi:hypothetical protein